MAPLNILINGGGIAGTALACLLSRQGQKVTVLERFPSLRTSGLQIDLRGFGIEVIKEMGLDEAFRAAAVTELGLKVVDGKGRQWAYFPTKNVTKGVVEEKNEEKGKNLKGQKKELQSFSSEYEIMRGDLCRIFYNAANTTRKEKVRWRFGSELINMNEHLRDGKRVVDVSILDNDKGKTTEETFDLVVGCDGVGSKTRRLMTSPNMTISLDKDPAFQPYQGEYYAYFTIDGHGAAEASQADNSSTIAKRAPSNATFYIAPSIGTMTRGDPNFSEQIYLNVSSRGPDSPFGKAYQDRDVAGQKAACAEVYENSGYWRKKELIEGLKGTENFYMEKLGLVKMDRWSSLAVYESGDDYGNEAEKEKRGRVVLVGDAGYCPSAKTGMGTTSALVGVWVLAGEIGRATVSSSCEVGDSACGDDPLGDALLSYEKKFRPFMEQVQKGLGGETTIFDKMLESRVGIAVLYVFMMILSWLRIDLIGQFVLKEDVKDWELPRY